MDCDNTLWGGVLGEIGMSNLILGQDGVGQAYKDFQKAIKKIKNLGIVLVLLSKNNEKDVRNVLRNHQDMILKKTILQKLLRLIGKARVIIFQS